MVTPLENVSRETMLFPDAETIEDDIQQILARCLAGYFA
jgi:hypothetical protein